MFMDHNLDVRAENVYQQRILRVYQGQAQSHAPSHDFDTGRHACDLLHGKVVFSHQPEYFYDPGSFVLRAGCCTKSAMENIELHLGKLPGLYDLYLTTYNKDFQISHIVVSGLQVCGFTQTKNCDVRAAEQHIQTMLEHDGYVGYTVHIYKSLDQYLDCLDALEQIRDPKEHKSSKGVTDLLLSISL